MTFEGGDEVIVARTPTWRGEPHPGLEKGHVGVVDTTPTPTTIENVLYVSVDGYWVPADCLEPVGPSDQEVEEVILSLTGRLPLPDTLAEAWEKGHEECICHHEWDKRAPCKNPYR